MKKIFSIILLSFIASINTFSDGLNNGNSNIINFNCDYFSGDEYLNNLQSILKKSDDHDKIICDPENDKVAYYIIGDDGLSMVITLGIPIDYTTTVGDTAIIIMNNVEKYSNIYKKARRKNSTKYYKLPDKEIVNIFGIINDNNNNKRMLYIGKIVFDTSTDNFTIFIFKELTDLIEFMKDKNPNLDIREIDLN